MTGRAELRCIAVSKWYGKLSALQDISFHLEAGAWGLLGPNGAGKSTLLSLLSGQVQPSMGSIQVAGGNPFTQRELLTRLGLCPEHDAFYEELSPIEMVGSLAAFNGVAPAQAPQAARAALERLGLQEVADRPIATLSRGMRQRVKLAQAIVHDPDILLLDEPLVGTDPLSRRLVLAEIKRRRERGALVLFSSHLLHEVEEFADRVLVLLDGRVLALGPYTEIRNRLDHRPQRIQVECERARELAASLIHAPMVRSVSIPDPGRLIVETHALDRCFDHLSRQLIEGAYPLKSMELLDASLESLFHELAPAPSSASQRKAQ